MPPGVLGFLAVVVAMGAFTFGMDGSGLSRLVA